MDKTIKVNFLMSREHREKFAQLMEAISPRPTHRSLIEQMIDSECERRGITPKRRRAKES